MHDNRSMTDMISSCRIYHSERSTSKQDSSILVVITMKCTPPLFIISEGSLLYCIPVYFLQAVHDCIKIFFLTSCILCFVTLRIWCRGRDDGIESVLHVCTTEGLHLTDFVVGRIITAESSSSWTVISTDFVCVFVCF